MTIVFKRNDLYLSESFYWGNSPNAFEWWRADELQAIFDRMKKKPTHYAQVEGGSIDLDKAKWIKI